MAVALTIFSFHEINPMAAKLFIPYLGWLCMAMALTYTIWRDNREECGADAKKEE